MSELKYWLWLSSLCGIRPRVKTLLVRHYGGPREIFFAPRGEYKTFGGISEAECLVLEDKNLDNAMRVIDLCSEKAVTVITMQDAFYPCRLANIYDPPAVIYVMGRLPAVDEEAAVSVVGTRRATPYGIKMAARLGYEITKCGGLVVSGLTAGIDAEAARGALLAGGSCVGVLGSAIGDDYGGSLARDVSAVGAIVSEYPPGAVTRASNFRARNRITAGLSVAAAVVEAPEKSGALLFADEALEQGKEIFVVPSNADSVIGAGSNALLKDGAKPIMGGWDILCEFESRFPGRIHDPGERKLQMPKDQVTETVPAEQINLRDYKPETGESFIKLRVPAAKKTIDKQNDVEYIDLQAQLEKLTETQLKIVSVMSDSDMHVDDIIENTRLAAAAVLAELTMLQIMGFVTQGMGKRFTLNIKRK
ncbi:MAG: DNA-processing protein DprA [Clostridia bacterium]|nr:DNA-processing protein DprA [Clostridia bacterium]